jgi:K+-sensing histidine kinase KdpD
MTDLRISELENMLILDENALDEALEQQPDLFYRVSKELALTVSRRDFAKQTKEEVEATVDAKIRHTAAVQDEKITERQIESEKRLHKDVQKAIKDLFVLNEKVGHLSALKEAFQQRSYVLKSLCDLYIAGYFGSNMSGTSERMKEHNAGEVRRDRARGR